MSLRKTLLGICVALLCGQAMAQTRDEFLAQMNLSREPKEKLEILAKAAQRSLDEGDGEEAMDLAQMGLAQSLALSASKQASICSQVLAEIELSAGDGNKALPHALRALVFGKEDGPLEEGRSAFLLSRVYARLGLFDRSAEMANTALESRQLTSLQICWVSLAQARAVNADKHPTEALAAYRRTLVQARSVKASEAELESMVRICAIQSATGDLNGATAMAEALIPLLRAVGTPLEIGVAYNNLGEIFSRSGRYQEAIDAFGNAGAWLTNEPDAQDRMLMNLVIACAKADRLPQAHLVLNNVTNRITQRADLSRMPHVRVLRAGLYLIDGRLTQAAEEARAALNLAASTGQKQDQLDALTLLERLAQERGLSDEARKYAAQAKDVQEDFWNQQRAQQREREEALLRTLKEESGIMTSLNEEQRNRMELMQTILEAENEGKQIDIDQYKKDLQRSFERQEALLQEQARQAVDIANATLEAERRDNEITALEGQRQLQVLQLSKLDLEKQQKESAMAMLKRQNDLLESDRRLKASEQHRDRMISRFAIAAVVVLAGLCAFAFWVMKKVRMKNRIIHTQVKEIEGINLQLNHSNEEMMSSIRYAQRIQSTIVPSIDQLRSLLPDSFVYYRPRDVVSGDLPFVRRKGDHLYIAAIDCTGHGVPAAMLSFIAYYNLNDLISTRHDATPAEILTVLHDRMLTTTEGAHGRASLSDGMDIGLARIDLHGDELLFSGAQMSMMVERDGLVERIKGDLCSIGDRFGRENAAFTDHALTLSASERIYLFSDGLAHQFGGKEGRQKFSYKRMSEHFRGMAQLDALAAEQHISSSFEEWKQGCEQTDDVLLIGFSARGTLASKAA